MAREWAMLTTAGKKPLAHVLTFMVIGFVVYNQLNAPDPVPSLLLLVIVAMLGMFVTRFMKTADIGWTMIGLAYVGLPVFTLWWLRTLDSGQLVFWLLFIVFATDVGGYVFGKTIGGPKLAPTVSPKKTWAGLAGGMAVSVGISLLIAQFFALTASIGILILFSAVLALWAQVGDLVESAVKRHFDVKDSGELIPGHGGLLDRVDGLVFVAPAMAMLVYFLPQLFQLGQ